MTRHRFKNDGPYAQSAKPAMVFGEPTLSDITNNVYLTTQKETYESDGTPILHSGNDIEHEDLNTVYQLNTGDKSITPTVRQVQVVKKNEYHSFLNEFTPGGRGVIIIMIMQQGDAVRCNMRILPFSTFANILQNEGSANEPTIIEIPKSDVIKLNITLTASNVGEVLYSTHKTQVNLEETTENESVEIARTLEFKGAKLAAHYFSQMLTVLPSSGVKNSGKNSSSYKVSLANSDSWVGSFWDWIPDRLTGKNIVSGISAMGSAIAIALIPISPAVAALVGNLSGYTRGLMGFINHSPVLLDKTYSVQNGVDALGNPTITIIS
ncbi:MAG: hypothetical protein OXE99_10045 [Cellvibrionales bacterium]|nr:hypothetical protein [Cellvibrionales bacterium]